jgi:hypothetical protein
MPVKWVWIGLDWIVVDITCLLLVGTYRDRCFFFVLGSIDE